MVTRAEYYDPRKPAWVNCSVSKCSSWSWIRKAGVWGYHGMNNGVRSNTTIFGCRAFHPRRQWSAQSLLRSIVPGPCMRCSTSPMRHVEELDLIKARSGTRANHNERHKDNAQLCWEDNLEKTKSRGIISHCSEKKEKKILPLENELRDISAHKRSSCQKTWTYMTALKKHKWGYIKKNTNFWRRVDETYLRQMEFLFGWWTDKQSDGSDLVCGSISPLFQHDKVVNGRTDIFESVDFRWEFDRAPSFPIIWIRHQWPATRTVRSNKWACFEHYPDFTRFFHISFSPIKAWRDLRRIFYAFDITPSNKISTVENLRSSIEKTLPSIGPPFLSCSPFFSKSYTVVCCSQPIISTRSTNHVTDSLRQINISHHKFIMLVWTAWFVAHLYVAMHTSICACLQACNDA